jgi:signal transduction histidine kinase/CheY-like chemotaxis protein
MLQAQDIWYGSKLKPSSVLFRYGVAVLLFCLGLSGRFALIGLLPPTGFPFLTFFPAVMITAFVAGLWPGILVALLSILSAWFFFIVPSEVGVTSGDLLALAFFSLILVIDCVVIHLMTTAMARARSRGEELALSEGRYRAMADKLQQADTRKDEFLAMLAHELRNPLAPIAAAADLLSIGVLGEDKVRTTSQVIKRQVRHLTGLIDDLLDVSRVTRGLVRLEQQRLDMARVAEEAVEQIRPLLDRRHQRFSFRNDAAEALVLGDQKRLVQVVANLLNNAAKFSPDGGTIALLLDEADGQIRLTVTDDGAGMSPAFLDQAFELFAQCERTSDRSQGGLGIGLALVRSLVELHGGRVVAASDGLGQGSRFTVWLPQAAQIAPSPVSPREPDAVPSAQPGLRVLIVDDNIDAADMLGMFIESLGHHVTVETSSKQALVTAATMLPQVCLLDIGLPEMDGNQLARHLRASPPTEAAMLVAISGYGTEQDRINSTHAGFDHHLVKPVDMLQLKKLLGSNHPALAAAGS